MILQFEITEQNQTINLPTDIHAQEFVFRRAIVFLGGSFPNVTLGGGIVIDLSFMTGFDIISNGMGEKLYIGMNIPAPNALYDQRYEFNFSAEDIKRSFTSKVSDFNGNLMDFGASGIMKIILFFEFNSLDPYINNY